MSSRKDRRVAIKKSGFKSKTLQEWKAEFTKLPYLIQYLLTANITNTPIGSSVIKEAKEKYPQYWNEQDEFTPIKWDEK